MTTLVLVHNMGEHVATDNVASGLTGEATGVSYLCTAPKRGVQGVRCDDSAAFIAKVVHN